MRVSVVLCTYTLKMYNHFRRAAESVRSQTYDDVELMAVVDGNAEVCDRVHEDYGDREDVILHYNDENVGLLESRTTGAELAIGNVVAFTDDAIADDHRVKKLVECYEKHDALAGAGR